MTIICRDHYRESSLYENILIGQRSTWHGLQRQVFLFICTWKRWLLIALEIEICTSISRANLFSLISGALPTWQSLASTTLTPLPPPRPPPETSDLRLRLRRGTRTGSRGLRGRQNQKGKRAKNAIKSGDCIRTRWSQKLPTNSSSSSARPR